jgi:hypothetical protein
MLPQRGCSAPLPKAATHVDAFEHRIPPLLIAGASASRSNFLSSNNHEPAHLFPPSLAGSDHLLPVEAFSPSAWAI